MEKNNVHGLGESAIMRHLTLICYLFSLLSFGMGYAKMLVYTNATTEPLNTSDYTIDLSLATSFFVLAIFLAIIGFAFFWLKDNGTDETSARETTGHKIISLEVGDRKLNYWHPGTRKCYEEWAGVEVTKSYIN